MPEQSNSPIADSLTFEERLAQTDSDPVGKDLVGKFNSAYREMEKQDAGLPDDEPVDVKQVEDSAIASLKSTS